MTTLTIHKEEDEQRQLHVTVDVAEDRVQKAMRQKARELGREIRVPGFRPGKAPYNVVVNRVGKDALRYEAVEDILDEIYNETLVEVDVQPYGQPKMDDMEMEPLRLFFTIPLEPVVTLANYREIRREMAPVEITEEAVEDALDHVRTHHEVVEPVDRPVELGDKVTYSGSGRYLDGEGEEQLLFQEERSEALMDPEVMFKDTPFVENLLGMEAGDRKEFSFTFAEEYEDENLAGREATFDITILDVQSRQLPELDDELAKLEGDYETLDELRTALRERLEEQAEQQARSDFFDAMVEDMLERAEIIYPPAALDAELDDMIASMREQVTQVGWEWDDYLRLQGQTEEDLRENWQERAENRLRTNLLLINFMREEKIQVDENRRNEAIEKQLANYEDEELRESMREYFASERGFSMLGSEILMDLILERMQAIGNGTAPDLAELEAGSGEEEASVTKAEVEEMAEEEAELADEEEMAEDETVTADVAVVESGSETQENDTESE